MLLVAAGCGPGGPATVPVKGTLTIGGQPANGVGISLVPADAKMPTASGTVQNGAFEVFSGSQGKPGAVPGKYKVVLNATSGGPEAAKQMYEPGAAKAGAKKSAAPVIKAPFPDKYKTAATSDKEVEITKGANELKIDIPAE
jgi:hypothetical protein